MDWSLDVNQDWLCDLSTGRERELAHAIKGGHVDEFCAMEGVEQYSHCRFIDWMAENYPATLYDIMLTTAKSAVEVLERGPGDLW